MNWKNKAIFSRAVDKIPYGHKLYFLAQKYIVGSVPRTLLPVQSVGRRYLQHVENFARLADGQTLKNGVLFEFGAGWELYSNIVQWMGGINNQFIVDITPLFKPELFNDIIEKIAQQADDLPDSLRVPTRKLGADWKRDLKNFYGIEYHAPMDAGATSLEDDSISFFASTNTLEHIPFDSIRKIILEMTRIGKPGALVSFEIGYWDHYRLVDSRISGFNYMQFSEAEWARYNPDSHYQNRLRHPDFLALFESHFDMIAVDPVHDPKAEKHLAKLDLDARFSNYSLEELAIESANFIMRVR